MKKLDYRKHTANGYRRYIQSLGRKGKIQSENPLTAYVAHSRNISHLVNTKNVFSTAGFSKVKKDPFLVPKIFSLVDSPESSYYFLKELLFSLYKQDHVNIEINFKECERIDLDASLVMDVILKDIIYHYRKSALVGRKPHVNSIKIINANDKIKRFLLSTGAFKNVANIDFKDPTVLTYPLCIGFRTHKENDQAREAKKEKDVTDLVDYVIECVRNSGKELTQNTKKNLADIAGEIIANAEDHSSTNYRYSIGYFDRPNGMDKHFGIFNLVIMNFGQSIYERLRDPKTCKNKEIITRMEDLSSAYLSKKWFLPLKLQEETLWTLYAIQDGVSSVSPHRGNGMIKFLDCFFKIKGSDASDEISKLTIFSGNASITYDGKYPITEQIIHGYKYKRLTFNDSGQLKDKPDEKFVRFVPNYFPGTIIVAKILLTQDDLK